MPKCEVRNPDMIHFIFACLQPVKDAVTEEVAMTGRVPDWLRTDVLIIVIALAMIVVGVWIAP